MKFFNWGRKEAEAKPAVAAPNAKQQRAYAAAQFGRLVSEWIAQGTSADSELKVSLRAVRNRGRQLARDNDYVRAFLREAQNNIVGTGIPFKSRIRLASGAFNSDLNRDIEKKWKRWTRKEFCDVSGKLHFSDIERLAVKACAESGELYLRKVYKKFGGSKIPLGLQVLEGDQIDDMMNGRATNGNEIRMGHEVDEYGRTIAYYVKSYHPGDFQYPASSRATNDPIRVPADDIIPLFLPERFGQTRGVPWIVSAIIRLHHMQGYEEAEIIAARAGASLMGFIESEEGELLGDSQEGDNGEDGDGKGDRLTEFQPGVFKYLAKGEKMNIPDLNRPSGQFEGFNRAMLKGVAAGAGGSFESISKDYSQSNYSSSRLAISSERDNWRILQDWLVKNFHQPIFEAWLDMAVLAGEIRIPDYEKRTAEYQDVRWLKRGWSYIDPLKDISANKIAVDEGFTSYTAIMAQNGDDIEEVLAERAYEQKLAKQYQVNLGTESIVDQEKLSDEEQEGKPDANGKKN